MRVSSLLVDFGARQVGASVIGQMEGRPTRAERTFAYIMYIAKCRSLCLETSQALILGPPVLQIVYICGADVSGVACEDHQPLLAASHMIRGGISGCCRSCAREPSVACRLEALTSTGPPSSAALFVASMVRLIATVHDGGLQ